MNLFGITLGTENTKLGPVFNFSLPSRITCPGASPWCKKHCYAWRYERRRPRCRNAYQRNLELTRNPDQFAERMIAVLPRLLPCFRIHVSGDFPEDRDYIQAWIKICQAFPQMKFWAYTRSWVQPDLYLALERLQELPNMNLFLSTDPTMPLPPGEWRVAFIEGDPRAKGILCPEQIGERNSCLDCGYCFLEKEGNVIFKIR